jgi:ABC-2 type transport system permease protein
VPTLTIALKDLRLLLRDPRSAIVLVVMPLAVTLILGLTLGRVFTDKPDSKLRVTVLVEDEGLDADATRKFPDRPWSDIFLSDLADTANIRVERVASRAEAEALVARGDRSAVVVIGPDFSRRCLRCSVVGGEFKADPVNPLFRDGIRTSELDVSLLTNPTQPVGSAVIQQVVQVSLLRVVIPWMIGQAFDLIGTDRFMEKMEGKIPALGFVLRIPGNKAMLGAGIRGGIGDFFSEYDFNAKTWAGLTESKRQFHLHGAVGGFAVVPLKNAITAVPAQAAPERAENRTAYADPRDAQYQLLVPGTTVTFAFFLLLTVGWLFVAERRHNTLVRLRLAPVSRTQIILGKALPCYAISLFQGFFLLACGKLIFGMTWGTRPELLIPVVAATSLAAVGLSMLVAGLAKTETQVAVYGTLLVIVLAGVSGSLLPRELLPANLRQLSLLTPHAWALDAYSQLLSPDVKTPQVGRVWAACGVLCGFGIAGLLASRFTARLD